LREISTKVCVQANIVFREQYFGLEIGYPKKVQKGTTITEHIMAKLKLMRDAETRNRVQGKTESALTVDKCEDQSPS